MHREHPVRRTAPEETVHENPQPPAVFDRAAGCRSNDPGPRGWPCRCPIEVGHRSTTTTLIANVACDRKRYPARDAGREQFADDPQANAMLTCAYREPWRLAGL